MESYKLSRFALAVPILHPGPPRIGIVNLLTNSICLSFLSHWHEILSGADYASKPQQIDQLIELGILVPKDADEMQVYQSWQQQHAHDFNTIKSKILLTRACNMDCSYCISKSEPKHMTSEIAESMDRFYLELVLNNNVSAVEDDFLGGEPLLNLIVLLDIAKRRNYFCRGRDMDYQFKITTNGTQLNPEIVTELKKVGLTKIHATLVGPEALHNRLRPLKSGQNGYERIVKNLEAISGMVPIDIECQYDKEKLDYLSIPVMMDDLVSRGIEVENIAIIPIMPQRGQSGIKNLSNEAQVILYLDQEARRRGFNLNDNKLPSTLCMSDFRSYFVFDADGSIIPCPCLGLGEMAYGNVLKGVDFLAEAQLLHRRFHQKCLTSCEFLPICMGGCRLEAEMMGEGFNGVACRYDTIKVIVEDHINRKCKDVQLPT